MTVLVTGGAGYIGSHMVHALLDRGEQVVVLDNLSTGVRAQVAPAARFVQGDVQDAALLKSVFAAERPDAVFHFAGSIVVPESVEQPLLYYANNTAASRTLMQACVESGVKRFIFSSTAAVYGAPQGPLVDETAPTIPLNPYGTSKLMTEWMLRDTALAHDFSYMALRYFNVAGADPQGRTGQSTPRATHLIKRACQAILGRVPHLDVFGTDYETPDGTGIRDYIHVSDLANAHLLALEGLRVGKPSAIYNCGYGRGFSVREVIQSVERVAGKPVPVREGPRRLGDAASLVADSARLKADLHWQPRHDQLDEIVRSALAWESRLAG